MYTNMWHELRECLRAGLPSGLPSTASAPVCVSVVLGMLACGYHTKKNKKSHVPAASPGLMIKASPCEVWHELSYTTAESTLAVPFPGWFFPMSSFCACIAPVSRCSPPCNVHARIHIRVHSHVTQWTPRAGWHRPILQFCTLYLHTGLILTHIGSLLEPPVPALGARRRGGFSLELLRATGSRPNQGDFWIFLVH